MIQLTHARVTVPEGGKLLRLKGVLLKDKSGQGRLPVLHDLTLWLGRGESWAVLGEPGAGKTTLLRLIAGQIIPEKGSCTVHGRTAAAIGLNGLLPRETGAGNVKLSCGMQGLDAAGTRGRIAAVGAHCGLGEQYHKPVSGYDKSTRARLLLSMALVQKPNVLLLSDVLEHCDLPFQQACVTEIRRMQRAGMTLLMESGNPALLRRLCESALWLSSGRLHRLGTFETVYGAYSFPRAVPSAPQNSKQLLERERAAFSAPLSPAAGAPGREGSSWPPEARRALNEAEALIQRLNDQLTAYASANLAFEQENLRLENTAQLQEAHAKQADAALSRMLAAFSQTLQVMYAQFLHLKQSSAPTKRARKK